MTKSSGKKHSISLRPIPSKSSRLKATIVDQSGAGRKRIGEILSKEGYITSRQLEEALRYQEKHLGRLSSILVKLGYVDEEIILNVLNRVLGYPIAVLTQIKAEPKALEILPYDIAKQVMAFPLELDGETLKVAMSEPTNAVVVEKLQNEVRKSLEIYVSPESDIIEAYRVHYRIDDKEYAKYIDEMEIESEGGIPITEVEDFGSLVSKAVGEIELSSPQDDEDALDEYTATDAPIIKLVNGILIKAINEGVSDIHIEPFEKSLQVRYRLDGELYMSMNLPHSIKNALTSRIKILSRLNIAERRMPQDGRFAMKIDKRNSIDFRVSTLPTLHGEKIVMRILDNSAVNIDLTKLGFEPDTLAVLKQCICRPYGLLIVTGPTGSGKTTTLYSVLNALNKVGVNIMTAEDPVEFNFKGINQVDIKNAAGMTFPAALRAFLRQDPDIIMVGEIRDLETAEIAIKAAMTGHLVLSTLHTNDCPSAIGRLVDIGIPPYLLSASLTMVISQRLIRTLCSNCKMPVTYEKPNELVDMGFSKTEIPDLNVFVPKGCPACNNIGYKGRIGLFELMAVTDAIAKAIYAADPEDRLRQVARQEGMITLREAGLEKIRQGVTSVDEVLKHTIATKEVLLSYLLNPELKYYDDKDVIIREGTHDKDFFSLVQGTLMVKKKGKIIAKIMEPGEFFGEMAPITGNPRSASIISKGKSIIKRFPGDKLPEIIEQYPDISKELFGMMASRLGRVNRQIVLLRESIRKPEGKPVIAVEDQRSKIDRRRMNAPGCGVERRIGTDRRVSVAG